jgi:hypothetical protein
LAGAPASRAGSRPLTADPRDRQRSTPGGELEHPDFLADLNTLIVHQPGGYDILAAADLLMEHLGAHLKNAPSYAEITNGTWRE